MLEHPDKRYQLNIKRCAVRDKEIAKNSRKLIIYIK